MIAVLVEAVKAIFEWILNRTWDFLCVLAFTCSLVVVWRIPFSIQILCNNCTSLSRFRANCWESLGMALVDVFQAICFCVLLVSWRCPKLLYNVSNWFELCPTRHNWKLRGIIAGNALLLFPDLLLAISSVVMIVAPWRLYFVCVHLWGIGTKLITDEFGADHLYPPIFKNMWKAWLDVMVLPFALVILCTGIRILPCIRDVRNQTDMLGRQKAILENFGALFVDIPCVLCGVITIITMWRARVFLADIKKNWNDIYALRRNCVYHVLCFLRDIPFFVLFFVLLPTLVRWWNAVRELRSRCSASADPTPQLSVAEVRPEVIPAGTTPIGRVGRIFVKGTKPTDLKFTTATMYLPENDNQNFWDAISRRKGRIVASLAKSSVPLKMCPKFVCASDFRAGATDFSTTVKLPMYRETLTDVVYSISALNPLIRLRLEYGNHEGTLIDVQFKIKDYIDAIESNTAIPFTVPVSDGKAGEGENLCDIFYECVGYEFVQLVLDLFAFILFLTHVVIPTRILWACRLIFSTNEAAHWRKVRQQIWFTVYVMETYSSLSWDAFQTACFRDMKPPISFLIIPPRTLRKGSGSKARYTRLTNQSNEYLARLNRCRTQFQTLGEENLSLLIQETIKLELKSRLHAIETYSQEFLAKGYNTETSLEYTNLTARKANMVTMGQQYGCGAIEYDRSLSWNESRDQYMQQHEKTFAELQTNRSVLDQKISSSPWSTKDTTWYQTRAFIFQASYQRTIDMLTFLCVLIITASVYRLPILLQNLMSKKNKYQRRKICIQQFCEILVDIMYFVKFALCFGTLRHSFTISMDLLSILNTKRAVIPLRQCIDGYIARLLSDFLYAASWIINGKLYRYFIATTLWGVFVPALTLTPILHTNRKPVVITFVLLYISWMYGWPFVVTYVASIRDVGLQAYLSSLAAMIILSVSMSVHIAQQGMKKGSPPETLLAPRTPSKQEVEVDISPIADGAKSRFLNMSWGTGLVVFNILLEPLQLYALVNTQVLNSDSSWHRWLLLDVTGQRLFALICVLLFYLIACAPVVIVGILNNDGQYESPPWKAWMLLTRLLGGTFVLVIDRILLSSILTNETDILSLLALAVYIPLSLMHRLKLTKGASHHLDVHFSDLYVLVRTALLHLMIGVCCVLQFTQGRGNDVTGWVIVVYVIVAVLVTWFYDSIFSSYSLCPIEMARSIQISVLGVTSIFVTITVIWKTIETPPSFYVDICGGACSLLCMVVILRQYYTLRTSPTEMSLQTTMDEVRQKLLNLENALLQRKGLSKKWSLRKELWTSRVHTALTCDILALMLLKLERHIGIFEMDAVFTKNRTQWAKDVLSLVSNSQRLRYTKLPYDNRQEEFVYWRFLPFNSRHFIYASTPGYKYLAEIEGIEVLLECIQGVENTVRKE